MGQQADASPAESTRARSAQPCRFTRLRKDARPVRDPLLIPRSKVRILHGPPRLPRYGPAPQAPTASWVAAVVRRFGPVPSARIVHTSLLPPERRVNAILELPGPHTGPKSLTLFRVSRRRLALATERRYSSVSTPSQS